VDEMAGTGNQVVAASEQRRAEWAQRVESFARDAAPHTRPFAEALVSFVAPAVGARVLDVATGSGIAAVEAAKWVGPTGSVVATDFVPEWQPYVAAEAAAAGLTNVAFAAMPVEALALPDESFDAVLCQFGLMFVAERVHALREMRRVLRPGGTLGLVVWSVPEKVGLFRIPGIVGAALPPPEGEAPPSPMGLSAPGPIDSLVAEAGFREIVVERVTRTFELSSAEDEWRRWRADTSMPIARGLAALPEARQQELHAEAIAALESFRDGAVIRVPSEAILVKAER
jgi:SAM-dependent methyltransferase